MRLSNTIHSLAAAAILAATNASLASTVPLGSLTPFTGGDAAEGLDLSGNIIHAFNLGGTAQTVQGVNFAAASVSSLPTGVTTTGSPLEFDYTAANPGGANAADYGATADDDALENMTTSVWYGGNWTIDLAVTPGTQYQLQLILQEGFWQYQGGIAGGAANERNFNISVETASPDTLSLGLANFVTGVETDGADAKQPGADFGQVYTYTFTATDSSFRVSLDDNPGDDPNTALNALTLEEVGADVTAPNLAATDPLSPADDATVGVAVGADLVATFDETVQAGASGTIELRRTTGGDALVESLAVTDTTPPGTVTFSGNSVTIDPTADLVGGVEYYVLIDVDAIVDTSANANGFAGITIGNWSFSPDVTAPGVGTIDIPTNGATGVSPTGSLALTFDEDMQKGTGNIVIKRTDDGTTVEDTIDVTTANVVISGGQVTIMPTVILPSLTGLYVEIADGALQDLAGNSFAGISGSGTWSFTTGEIVLFDDFSTDPNLATEWTEYSYFGSENVTPVWDSINQDLDLAGGGSGGKVLGLYRNGSARSATDPVTLTVKDFSQTGGTWGQVGLMIGDTAQPGLLDSNEKYEWHIHYSNATGYNLRARKDVGSGSYELFSENLGASFSGPVKLDILRVGDDYQFLANDVLKYTADGTGLDVYDTATKDSLVNYQITFGGDAPGTATVDDFGIGTVVAGDTFSDWQTANSTAGGLDDDHDGDGVENGVEFFLGGPNDTTGFTALPGVDNTGGTLSTTWAKASDYPGTYGTDFWVETSSTLLPGSWTVETLGVNVTVTGDDVKYTFPAGTRNFARLVVAGP